jgi:lipopolysaccharide export system protein LptC
MSAADMHSPFDPDAPPPGPRTADFARWRRHSRTIAVLRRVLPALMAVIVLALLGGVAISGLLGAPSKIREALGAIHMVNPKFQGRDSKGRSFVLSAKEASRDEHDPQQVLLVEPFVSLGQDTPTPTRLMAKTGVYREGDRLLHLYGDVRLDDGSGYRFASQDAVVDTRKGELVGKSSMAADGPMGQVQAGSVTVDNKGKRAIFKGGVRARLNQH